MKVLAGDSKLFSFLFVSVFLASVLTRSLTLTHTLEWHAHLQTCACTLTEVCQGDIIDIDTVPGSGHY